MFVWRPAIWILVYMPNYLASTHTAENYGTLRQDTLDTAVMLLLFAIGIGAQVYRYRRFYKRTQQLQTKWVLWGILIAVIIVGTYVVTVNAFGVLQEGGAGELLLRLAGRTARQIALFMVPLTLAFSILRYRLWDINLLVRRTLIYAPLTALLAGLFATLITLARLMFEGQRSFLLTMGATIVVAIAAEPLRNFLQRIVDRRFKDVPDPHRQLEKFGERVQERLSLVHTKQILRRFAEEAMHVYEATEGAAYVIREDGAERIYQKGEAVEEAVRIAVRARGKPVGAIALGERRQNRPYSAQDFQELDRTAAIVGMALEQDNAV